MKDYITAVAEVNKEGTEDEGVTEIPITEMEPDPDKPGETRVRKKVVLRAHQPESGQLGYLLATTGRYSTDEEKVSGLLNFFVAILDDEDASYIADRLLNRKDPFGLEQVNEIMEDLIEEWSGRPIKQPSDFATSQRTGGRKSNRPTRALTSSS